MKMKLKIKLTLPNAKLPIRVNPTDGGADLVSPIKTTVLSYDTKFIDLGFQMEIPEGYAGFIYARSGLGSKYGIIPRNCVGIIDSKYRGNVGMMVENKSENDFVINIGDRIAQIVIAPIVTPEFVEADELDMVDDRNGGFGSTGIGTGTISKSAK